MEERSSTEVLLVQYLQGILPTCLNVALEDVERAVKRCKTAEFDTIGAFVQDEQQLALYVEKGASGAVVIAPEVSYSSGSTSALLLKRSRGPLTAVIPVAEQVQFALLCGPRPVAANLKEDGTVEDSSATSAVATSPEPSAVDGFGSGASNPNNTDSDTLAGLYSFLHHGFTPLLRSYTTKKTTKQAEEESAAPTAGSGPNAEEDASRSLSEALKQALPIINKRMNELEYAMRSCLQSMEIPEIKLAIDPIVVEAVSKKMGSRKDLSLDELGLGEDVRDSKTLNRLQGGINRWVKEIQKVTKLERDASSGTVAQEVQFWHNMERAIQQIQKQVDGVEVKLTLEILKQSRRALATIVFENDTGLQLASKRVSNYMILMQDFPIGGLLSATDITQIEESIVQIFTHLKRIKSADEYPLTQALRLVEALSRDLANQLVSVLSLQQLMLLPYNEFEATIFSCQSLFRTWDEHVRSFRELVRDLAKRRGSERISSKMNYEHVALQDRIEEIRVFRAGHEKLRDVIERVVVVEELKENASLGDIVRTDGTEDDKENLRDAAPGPAFAAAVTARRGRDASFSSSVATLASSSSIQIGESGISTSLDEVKAAYQLFKPLDVLDVSRDGGAAWENARKLYEKKIDRVERRIIERLTDKLGAAKTADEMFRVFSKFNALFFRPRIRGAIQQFQSRLISTVEEDIEALQKTFKKSYSQSQASLMSRVKDVPPVSGAIIWARQIERQLEMYLKRIESVLGTSWEQHVDGRRLKEIGVAFKKKLNTQQMFDQWMKNIQAVPTFEVSGRIFSVEQRPGTSEPSSLVVNFDSQIIELFKEVRNLQWLGFKIPYTLKIISDEAKEKYPFAMALQSTLEAYKSTVAQLDEELQSLLSVYIKDVQMAIESTFNKGKAVNWDSDNLREFTSDFSQAVYTLQNKVDDATQKCNLVSEYLLELKTCPYTATDFVKILDQIQKVVDEMNLASYSNLSLWVASVEKKIDAILLERLKAAVEEWVESFESPGASSKYLRHSKHEIVLRKHALYLDPPLESARLGWIRSFHAKLAIVCNLKRIQSSRYDSAVASATNGESALAMTEEGESDGVLQSNREGTFADLLQQLAELKFTPQNTSGAAQTQTYSFLGFVYGAVQRKMDEVASYVKTWLQYQSLWEMEASDIFERMGQDIDLWQDLLTGIQQARATFDTAEHAKHFGSVIVDFQQVQAQVSLRYDAWHREILTKFSSILGEAMKQFHANVCAMRDELEHGSLDGPTSEVVSFITVLNKTTLERTKLSDNLQGFVVSEKLLLRQRFTFPSGWIFVANVQGEWDAFDQILNRKLRAMELELASLQSKILVEDRAVGARIQDLSNDWSDARPTNGTSTPLDALNLLAVYEGRGSRLADELERVQEAKEALSLGSASINADDVGSASSLRATPAADMLETLRNEVKSLKQVWTALGEVSGAIVDLRELPWTAVVPKKLRSSLDEILEKLKKMPAKVQQYEAFEYTQSMVRSYKKAQNMIVELRSESLKDRHWRQIVKILCLQNVPMKDLTLGDLWAKDLAKYQRDMGEIFRTAQGEMALEEFLRQIREFWSAYEFDLVNFQNRCKLIRGWDDLFSQLDEHTTSLASMKQSPYFRVFEEDAAGWEDKLTRIRIVLDLWIDVQRRWVYLGGILLGSADIKQQLPTEHSRFMSIDNEFVTLMRKVSRTPRIMEVITNIPSLDHSLSRLADLLEKIQRALGDYLERQRQSFSRFYFVGDEDLLEIIGNAKDPIKIQRHMSKMFAGISTLLFENGDSAIQAFCSREGETVAVQPQPLVVQNVRVNEWLLSLERTMRVTLLALLKQANTENPLLGAGSDSNQFTTWLDRFPSQILILASQVAWSSSIDSLLSGSSVSDAALREQERRTDQWLAILAERVLVGKLSAESRKKHEQLITEMVHQRDVLRKLDSSSDLNSYSWLSQLRYSWSNEQLELKIASASFNYGFEYQGVGERLVQTPLTDRCYLALTQALHFRQGGNPFGPAGTGKTESVKALGAQLGRFVLVFNCDEHFDLHAMGRIFVGLCQVGAWGCFDEFNRLEERILSAVSQQILNIQRGLLENSREISLIGKGVQLNPEVGIFVTMNPGYAGRSNLPDNLKQLFRSIAMIEPDRELIAQVMLFSQGFKSAERLSSKIVLLFKLCQDQLSDQPHYDFGLRAVKSVLLSAGNLKRRSILDRDSDSQTGEVDSEQEILIQSLCESVVPKLVSEDVALYQTLLSGVFPGAKITSSESIELRKAIETVCKEWSLSSSERWLNKVLQLDQVQQLRHGIMMVGPSGCGKSTSWRVLLEALEMVDGIKGQAYVIDPKALSKEALYGRLDPNTLEWTNGVFTHILRTILNNVRGEKNRRHWIVFDGDVDPEWAENLNSVLDDNKLLTLPNGERLSIPDNVRIMFEVETLRYATLATVSRCGMVWYSEDTLSLDDILENRLQLLAQGETSSRPSWSSIASKSTKVDTTEPSSKKNAFSLDEEERKFDDDQTISRVGDSLAAHALESECARLIQPFIHSDGLVHEILQLSLSMPHVMDVTRMRLVISLYSLLGRGVALAQEYNQNHPDFPIPPDQLSRFFQKWVLFSLLWGVGGSLDSDMREQLADAICRRTTVPLPASMTSLWDYEVNITDGEWRSWKESVPRVEIEPHKVVDTDVVISTVDTVRHVEVLRAWLDEHRPLILCGPPGSGKTMSLTSVLSSSPNFELASLNFSSATTPELILKTLEQYCVYKPTRTGLVLAPSQPDRWLVVFCDEVNLPAADSYGTQHVITFMRQIVEQGGFWRPKDLNWVSVDRVQFVSACNPPTDPGRVPLSHRFLRHSPLLYVGYPVEDSLRMIYGTFNRALLKLQPTVRAHGDALTDAMVDVYAANKRQFSADVAPHYVYSPRELSRWVRALYEALGQIEGATVDQLVRLWLHEGLRLFHDRLVTEEERTWCSENLDSIARSNFPSADFHVALARPVLFANWLSKAYVSVDQDELRSHVEARLRVFYEEELNVPLVVFDDVLEHVLRIDRVLRQPLGHLLLVGKSGAGKTVLSRFVAWMNGLRVFQIKLSRKYSLENFDEDLRYIMKQAGCNGERVCFIFDESNILDSAFLERMNALLASGEVPGLFEGDERNALMSACREAAQRDGAMIETDEEDLFREFTRNVQRNLHVVFTMNPASSDLKNRAATSPALFNRCVVDWFGDWSQQALAQVGYEFTRTLDLDSSEQNYRPVSIEAEDMVREIQITGSASKVKADTVRYRDAVVTCLVQMHESVQRVARSQTKRHENHTYVSPRDYLDIIHHFVTLYNQKRENLEGQQLHLNVGLDKLRETAEQVEELRKSLSVKERELEEKNQQANSKLQQMVSDQNEAEKKKIDAEKMGKELDERNATVADRKRVAEAELSEAEPALLDAQKAVSDIRKAHLDEMRALNNPPPAVKLTLEGVCLMLGLSFTGWTDIRRILQKREFIPDVVNFKSENLTEERRANVEKMMAENPDFVEEKVMHANKACVALFKWIVSQLNFARILLRIQPLRDEITKLADESEELTVRQNEEMIKVGELETQIVKLKEEYAVLIRETELIKSEMSTVKAKVERSLALLDSLSQENERWDAARTSFAEQMSTLVGDVLLSAGFISYCGFFGYLQRQAFLEEWKDLLARLGVHVKKGLSLIEYLSKPSQRLLWQANGLPGDDLCQENAIILHRFNRFPLIIDPSGQAADFLMQNLAEKKVVRTSFLDTSFMKQLESALRFGTCLVISDVENIDPILNPVLNREIHRTGGRMLVRLGDQDIDFSPTFSMFLTTRDPTFQFAPDVCSRVTFVNFTVTPASLQTQCLGKVLKSERPDVDKQREDLLKLQGEYQVRLRELEDKLLDSLNESQGNVLDDDHVVKTLENLKREAREIHAKSSEADAVMEKIEQVSAFYAPFATMCSNSYFALGRLSDIHFTYYYSLGFFLQVLDSLLSPEQSKTFGSSPEDRLKTLQSRFFFEVYCKAKHSLLEKDKLLWALLLAKVYLDVQKPKGLDSEALEVLWQNTSGSQVAPADSQVASIFADLPQDISAQIDLDAFKAAEAVPTLHGLRDSVQKHANEWAVWVKEATVDSLPSSLEVGVRQDVSSEKTNELNRKIYSLLVLKAFRPDKLLNGVENLVNHVFENRFVHSDKGALNLENSIATSHCRHPTLLLSSQGFDMSGKVELLASGKGVRCRSIAMGSPEGFTEADRVISDSAVSGGWVLLKNVHLASGWLQSLEKRIHNIKANSEFRLILTSEISEKIPKTVLRQSVKLVFEAPKGVRASLMRSLAAMPEDRMNRFPVERSRLYFLLAWFHAILLERLRFAPIGWTKLYEFSDADQSCALDVIDEWVDRFAKNREHISPEEIPWDALRSIFAESTYGGRIDNNFDQEILNSILGKIFVPKSFDRDFVLVDGSDGLVGPEGTSKAHFESWVSKLEGSNDPSWLGLSATAETLLLNSEGHEFLAKYLKVKDSQLIVEPSVDVSKPENTEEVANRPSWMSVAEQNLSAWIALYNQCLPVKAMAREVLKRDSEKVSNPIYRCFERESTALLNLLDLVGSDFHGLEAVFKGEQRMTNNLYNLAYSIHRKEVPSNYSEILCFGNKSVTIDMWVQDFFHKTKGFMKWLQGEGRFQLPIQYSLGDLIFPGGFLTSSRQLVAKTKSVSLENLSLVVVPTQGATVSGLGADFISSVVIEGGMEQSRTLMECNFVWHASNCSSGATDEILSKSVRLPLYEDSSRRNLISEVFFAGSLGKNCILRGVALVAHSQF